MTPQNRVANATSEMARAELSLGAATTLLTAGFALDAITRAYYAAYHATRALLFARGVEPKTHGGAIHLLNVEIVRAGLLDPSWNAILGRMQRLREWADYDPAVAIPASDAATAVADAERYLTVARALLAQLLPPLGS